MEEKTIQYADYFELNNRGIKHTISQGINSFGFQERTIICFDGTQWDYIPEDSIYEQRTENLYTIN
jgi:hypothetical protein